MSARVEMQEAVEQLLEKIIAYNRAKEREYFEMGLDIQKKHDIHDFVDMAVSLRHRCEDLRNNKEFINGLSDSELIEIEEILLSTAKEIGLDTTNIRTTVTSGAVKYDFISDWRAGNGIANDVTPEAFQMVLAGARGERVNSDVDAVTGPALRKTTNEAPARRRVSSEATAAIPTGIAVDFDFVIRLEGHQQLIGYVPQQNNVAIGRSGVTIASGFDIGQHNIYDLNRIFGRGPENADLRELFFPYLGLIREDAITFLAENPLTITQSQADRTDAAVMSQMVSRVANRYNNVTNGAFDQLPHQAQTALFSIGYHFGPNGIPVNIMMMINNGNYSGAADAIQNMGQTSGFVYRRTQEANLLRQVPNRAVEDIEE